MPTVRSGLGANPSRSVTTLFSSPNFVTKGAAGGSGSADVKYTYDAWNRLVKVQKYDSSATTYRTVNEFGYNGLHWRVRVEECSLLNVRPDSPMSSSIALDRDRLIYFDPSWRAVAESVDVDADGGYGEETADTIWGLTYIDEAIVSRRIGNGSSIGKGDPIYHLYDAQFSVVARMRDEGGVLPRMVERIRYSVYGEPTVFPYSFADCADTSSGDGPDGYITTHDNTRMTHGTTGWHTTGDVRADLSDDAGNVPMTGTNTGVTAADLTAFSAEYGANAGLFPVEGASSFVPGFWSSGGATGATGPTDSPVSDIGYCGYAWNPGSGQYAVRFRNYDPGLGRWLQRDPAGYVDGANYYTYVNARPSWRVDSLGLCSANCDDNPFRGHDLGEGAARGGWALMHPGRESTTPCPTLPTMNPITPLSPTMGVDEYFDEWKKANPGYTDEEYKLMRSVLARGCIGITECNLGTKSAPDLSNCYISISRAEEKQREMIKNCDCKGKGPPLIFGTKFWSNGGSINDDPTAFRPNLDTGKVDMTDYLWEGRPGHINFDYAWRCKKDGKWIHANHREPNMIVYTDSWSNSYDGFDRKGFCVTCGRRDFGDPKPAGPAVSPGVKP